MTGKKEKESATGFFQKKIVQIGSIAAAVVAIGGGGAKVLNLVDARYALASEIRPLHQDILEQRRDSAVERKEQIEMLRRRRPLTDLEHQQLNRYDGQVKDLDRKIRELDKEKR
jgi:hypothetical protein